MESIEIQWPERVFVTGIDTDAGKSYATGWLARLIARNGETVITQKLVQTGNKDYSEDIDIHRRLMGTGLLKSDELHITAPEIFSYPCSPDLAARIDKRDIDFKRIDDCSDMLAGQFGHLIIEGAGGVMVPLQGEYLTIDFIRERKLPTVLVTNGRLGSINHTLLSLYALQKEGIEVWAVVYNRYFDKDETIGADTRNYIKTWLERHSPATLYLEMPELKL